MTIRKCLRCGETTTDASKWVRVRVESLEPLAGLKSRAIYTPPGAEDLWTTLCQECLTTLTAFMAGPAN